MAEKRVMFVMPNAPDRDIRVSKESGTLKEAGYLIALLYWDRNGKSNPPGVTDGYGETHCLKLKAPSGIMLVFLLPVWWSYVFVSLLFKKWDVVHALNFHSIFPCLVAARLKKKHVVYDIIDFYEWRTPGFIRPGFLRLDKFFMRLADAVIVADETQIVGIGGIPNSNVLPIYDAPTDALDSDDARYLDYQDNKPFTLFYAGALYKNRQLNIDKVVEAVRNLEDVKLIIAGYGDLVDEIKGWSQLWPDKVEFIGQISYADVIKRGVRAHLFFVLRDYTIPTNRFICGSNIFNAMICGKPILVNLGTSTTQKVVKENCGIAVNPHDVDEIRQAIIRLRNSPQLCRELGMNARQAYEQRYGWHIMAKRLVGLYDDLTRKLDTVL